MRKIICIGKLLGDKGGEGFWIILMRVWIVFFLCIHILWGFLDVFSFFLSFVCCIQCLFYLLFFFFLLLIYQRDTTNDDGVVWT
jgi:hypothetical protein